MRYCAGVVQYLQIFCDEVQFADRILAVRAQCSKSVPATSLLLSASSKFSKFVSFLCLFLTCRKSCESSSTASSLATLLEWIAQSVFVLFGFFVFFFISNKAKWA